MGPLCKVWTIVDNVRSGKSGSTEIDTHKMLHLIEQSITPLGQSNVPFNFHRRLAILCRLTKSQRRAKIILKENDKYFKKSHSSSFGHAFHKKKYEKTVISWGKSHLGPTQTLEYLGMLIASVTMTLSLPERKLFATIQKCQCLLAKTVVTIREVSELIGLLSASARAVLSAPLHYRRLQRTQRLFQNPSHTIH